MFRKSILVQSVLMTMIAPSAVLAEVEATFELRNETAVYINEGQTIGQASSQVDTRDKNSLGELMKFQNQAKVFLNGDIGEESTWHGELQIIFDTEAINDEDNGGVNYKGHKNYTQNDFLRELYVDTEAAGWSWRLGKQQVVWGTADGIKLLDIINPTDFREVNQNVMEDARIPIWMINGETDFDNGSNLQVIVSQVEENKIPGLNPGGDQGQPFIMKGVDTITGATNGFLNIAPALASTATTFTAFANGGAFAAAGLPGGSGLVGATNFTVDYFAATQWDVNFGTGALTPKNTPVSTTTDSVTNITGTDDNGYVLLNAIAQNPEAFNPAFLGLGNAYTTALMDATGANGVPSTVTWLPTSNPQAAFDHMPNATFATFNTFSGGPLGAFGIPGSQNSMITSYVRDYPDDWDANAGFRWKNSTESGINYSLNYFYHYDANPVVDLSYHDRDTGEELITEIRDLAGTLVSRNNVDGNATIANAPTGFNTVYLRNSAGDYYGAFDPGLGGFNAGGTGVELRFTETLERIHSLGASFDMAVDGLDVPLVVRGEFLYDRDVYQPVVDKRLLAIGDLEGALQPVETDFFKYVLGADITVMTNLLVSAQFIQFINLDFVDEKRTCTPSDFSSPYDCSRYTADPTTMSVGNSLQKGWETKEFVSLFLSKPIGEDQLGRWNNIVIWEEGGGWWDRLDAEYSLSDQFIVNGEINLYFGDDDTTFGQLDKSSNVQVGFRYIFEDY